MQGADWLFRCRKNRGRIKTSQCDSLGILSDSLRRNRGNLYPQPIPHDVFLLSLNMDPVIIVKKNNKNNKQDNYNKKRVWLGENLKKKL